MLGTQKGLRHGSRHRRNLSVSQEAIFHSLTSQITFRRGLGQGNVPMKAENTHWPGLLSCTHLQTPILT